MLAIEDRLLTEDKKKAFPLSGQQPSAAPSAPYLSVNNPLSTPGANPSPNRGIAPAEYTYDTDMYNYFPPNSHFVRAFAEPNWQIRNLALQAFQGPV